MAKRNPITQHPGTVSRRAIVAAGVAGALWLPRRAAAAPSPAAAAQAAPDAGAAYFAETGHVVSGEFWQLWLAHGLDLFGYPISESFEDAGVRNQYFQRARFELHPGTAGVQLGLLGIERAGSAPPEPARQDAGAPGRRYIPETGHVVQGAFLPAYDRWQAIIGPPIGAEFAAGPGWMQYFVRARLEWMPDTGVRLGLLGSEIAARRDADTTPVPRPQGMPTWWDVVSARAAEQREREALGALASGGHGFVPEPDQRWIAVSIPQQRITAYIGTTPVFTDLCSTGLAAKGLTSKGVFSIIRRVANETMDSATIGIPKGDPRYYHLENVLYTQYFDANGTALHYAWWHNNFGHPMSYGCVNLRLSTAKWFWDWAGIGTPVVVA